MAGESAEQKHFRLLKSNVQSMMGESAQQHSVFSSNERSADYFSSQWELKMQNNL
jgi:hypothetical protein